MKVNLTVETVCEFLGMASLDRDLGSTEDIPVLMILRGMVKQFSSKYKTQEPQRKSSEVLCVLVSIFLIKIDLNLDKGFGFA